MKDNKLHIIRKKRGFFKVIYPILMTVLTYLPILMVVIYSFNGSRISSVWSGFSHSSLTWCALQR